MRTWDRLIVAFFLAAITVPGVATLAGVDGVAGDENREPAPPPTLRADWASLQQLPDAFTRYFEDHFAFRAQLVHAQARLRLEGLRTAPSPGVIVGRDGWLFYADDGAVEEYAVAPGMSAEDLEVFRLTLQDIQDALAARGIAYAFVIAPDKHVIYPEMMPSAIHRFTEDSRTDQLVAYLRDRSTVNVVDLRPALRRAKESERVYHKTDTHWNDRGAFVAYQAIVRALNVPGLEPWRREDFVAEQRPAPGLDLAGMLGLKDRLPEEDLVLRPLRPRLAHVVEPPDPKPHGIYARLVTEHPDKRLPRAVIYRDSFASALVPLLAEHFSRGLFLWERDVLPEVIDEERPAIVIQEWVGRRLGPHLPYDGFSSTASERRSESGADAETRTPSPAPQD